MSKTKSAETLRPALEVRLRVAGIEPPVIPDPQPDMRIADPRRREKALAKARLSVEHANKSAMSRALEGARAPWFGCNAGRSIAAAEGADTAALWDACQRVRSVYANWRASIMAPDPHPSGMNLELLPEEFGTHGVEVDGGWDDRTEEERVKDAARAMMHMEGVLGRAGYGVASEVKSVVVEDRPVKHPDRLIAGLKAVAADG